MQPLKLSADARGGPGIGVDIKRHRQCFNVFLDTEENMNNIRARWRRGPTAMFNAGILFALTFWAYSSFAQCLSPPGDLNGNGFVEIADIQCNILVALSPNGPAPACLAVPLAAADIDCDGVTNVVDIVILIQYAANEPLASSIDGNTNQCPDACEGIFSHFELPVVYLGSSKSTSYSLEAVGQALPTSGSSSSTNFTLTPATVDGTP